LPQSLGFDLPGFKAINILIEFQVYLKIIAQNAIQIVISDEILDPESIKPNKIEFNR